MGDESTLPSFFGPWKFPKRQDFHADGSHITCTTLPGAVHKGQSLLQTTFLHRLAASCTLHKWAKSKPIYIMFAHPPALLLQALFTASQQRSPTGRTGGWTIILHCIYRVVPLKNPSMSRGSVLALKNMFGAQKGPRKTKPNTWRSELRS